MLPCLDCVERFAARFSVVVIPVVAMECSRRYFSFSNLDYWGLAWGNINCGGEL